MPMQRKYSRHARFKNFLLFLWNPRRKMICNKTCPQWAQYILYYSGFYFLLFLFSVIVILMMLWTFTRFDSPWRSIILLNPGISLLPKVDKEYPKSYTSAYKNCSGKSDDNNKKPCFFNISKLGPCGEEPYGYTKRKPCVLLKLNKVFGWTPQKFTFDAFPKKRDKEPDLETSCEGKDKADHENIQGFNYFPSHIFPGSYFPFTNQKHYLQPLIGVQIVEPTRGMELAIDCTVRVSGKTLSSKTFKIEIVDRS